MASRIRALVVDDSALMRRYLTEILESDPAIEVVGTARDGEEAVLAALSLRPDVITLDINMPRMDGLTALQYIMAEAPCPVLVVSSLTQKGALATFEALELGAVDYIAKPEGTVSLGIKALSAEIVSKVKAVARANLRHARRARPRPGRARRPCPPVRVPAGGTGKIVVIGVSTGGPKTLMEILPQLPGDFPVPVVVVQHMPAHFTAAFAERLNHHCALQVKEAANEDTLQPGRVLVAPGGYHLKVRKRLGSPEIRCQLSREPATLYVPSVSVTLSSLLEVVGPQRLVGVLLTGMGDDGADEMVKIREGGGFTIAEAEETAIVWGMPREAIERGGATRVLPAYAIAQALVEEVTESAAGGNRTAHPKAEGGG
jgi:two-component system chemotaxis response regulator CheB